MGNPRQVITSFASGEISPRLFAHTDIKTYGTAARTLTNCVPQPHGGIIRRGGGKYIANTKGNRAVKLIPFQVSETAQYMLEFGEGYIRVFRDQAQLTETVSGDVTEIANGSGHTGGEDPPWLATELSGIRYAQSHDKLYLGHLNHKPLVLSRTSTDDGEPSSWDLSPYNYQDGPYDELNTDELYAACTHAGSPTADFTIDAGTEYTFELRDAPIGGTAQAHGWTTGASSEYIGRHFRWLPVEGDSSRVAPAATGSSDNTLEWIWFTITTVPSTTQFTATAQVDSLDEVDYDAGNYSSGVTEWRLGSWYGNTTTYNWPQTPQLHQSRAFWGGETLFPQTISATQTGDFEIFAPSSLDTSVLATSGFRRTVDDDRLNAVQWMQSDAKGIIVLTSGGPFLLHGGSDSAAITPSNVGIHRQNAIPCSSSAAAQKVGSGVVFPTASGEQLRVAQYAFDQDRFKTPDLSLRAEHILSQGTVVDTAFDRDPSETLWCALSTGQAATMVYVPDESVVAWSKHTMGGSLAGARYPAVEQIEGIRDISGEDLVYIVVKRTINGATERHIEVIQPTYGHGDDRELAWGLDSALATDLRQTIEGITDNGDGTARIIATNHGLDNTMTIKIRTDSPADYAKYGDVVGLREIHGKTYSVIEVDANSFDISEDISGHTAWVSGGSIAKQVTTVSGLDHLEGETVTIYADGAEQGTATVSSGAITLLRAASVIVAGLPYTMTVRTLPPVGPDGEKDPRAILYGVKDAYLYLHETIGGQIGYIDSFGVDGPLYDLEYHEADGQMDNPTPLFTGILEAGVAGAFSRFGGVHFQHTHPTPANLLGMVINLDSGNL